MKGLEENAIHSKYIELVKMLGHMHDNDMLTGSTSSSLNSNEWNEITPRRSRS